MWAEQVEYRAWLRRMFPVSEEAEAIMDALEILEDIYERMVRTAPLWAILPLSRHWRGLMKIERIQEYLQEEIFVMTIKELQRVPMWQTESVNG